MLPVFWFGDWTVSLDPWLRVSTGKQVSLPSLFSWSGSYENSSSLSPSSSSPIQSCDHACSALPPVACSRWIAASAVQWWRFSRISENLLEICANFVWILLLLSSVSRIPWWIQSFFAKSFWIGAGFELGFMRVLEFLWILWFWSVTAKRERKWILFVWCGVSSVDFWHCSLFISCMWLLNQWDFDTWTWMLAWHLDCFCSRTNL